MVLKSVKNYSGVVLNAVLLVNDYLLQWFFTA